MESAPLNRRQCAGLFALLGSLLLPFSSDAQRRRRTRRRNTATTTEAPAPTATPTPAPTPEASNGPAPMTFRHTSRATNGPVPEGPIPEATAVAPPPTPPRAQQNERSGSSDPSQEELLRQVNELLRSSGNLPSNGALLELPR